MAIQVGIRENIRIISSEKNEKGSLVINLKEDSATGGGGLLADLNATTDNNNDNENGMIIWPVTWNQEHKTIEEKSKDVTNKLKTLRARLTHILLQYMTNDKIQWNVFAGITINDEADLVRGLGENEAMLNKIYDNYATQFIAMLAPHVGPSSQLFRVKLIRQSKDKHYATLPTFAPFMEPMLIPKNQSKLAFSKYELGYRKGDADGKPTGVNLSDGTPVSTESQGGNPAEAAAVADLFGMGPK